MSINLSAIRFVAALKRQRERIASGLKLSKEDSDEPGNKFTTCTWGLCSDEKEAWPDAEDHLWPDQFESAGRVAPKYRGKGHACPMSRGNRSDGCFYDCRIFQKRDGERVTKEVALALYDAAIAKHQAQEDNGNVAKD